MYVHSWAWRVCAVAFTFFSVTMRGDENSDSNPEFVPEETPVYTEDVPVSPDTLPEPSTPAETYIYAEYSNTYTEDPTVTLSSGQDGSDSGSSSSSEASTAEMEEVEVDEEETVCEENPSEAQAPEYAENLTRVLEPIAQLSYYGMSDDPHGDSLTDAGLGVQNIRLSPGDIALSKPLEEDVREQGGGVTSELLIELADGTSFRGQFTDRVPSHCYVRGRKVKIQRPRVDVYRPDLGNSNLPDNNGMAVVGITPLNTD